MLFFLGYDNMEDKIEREEETKIILAFTPSATFKCFDFEPKDFNFECGRYIPIHGPLTTGRYR